MAKAGFGCRVSSSFARRTIIQVWCVSRSDDTLLRISSHSRHHCGGLPISPAQPANLPGVHHLMSNAKKRVDLGVEKFVRKRGGWSNSALL